jgi:hypothetical protein
MHAQSPARLTLLDLVEAVAQVTDDPREIVRTVDHLLRSGRVQLRRPARQILQTHGSRMPGLGARCGLEARSAPSERAGA